MVRLGDAHRVNVFVYQACQILVDHKHDVHAQAEVGGRYHSSARSAACVAHLFVAVVPACGSAHYGDMAFEAAEHVLHRRLGCGELYRHIGLKPVGPGVAEVNLVSNLISCLLGMVLDGMAHLTVSN